MEKVDRCFVCGSITLNGIYVLGKFICINCVYELMDLDVNSEKYDEYRKCMIKIWEDYIKTANLS